MCKYCTPVIKIIRVESSIQDDECRYGCHSLEIIQNLTGGCQKFAATEYKERHEPVVDVAIPNNNILWDKIAMHGDLEIQIKKKEKKGPDDSNYNINMCYL